MSAAITIRGYGIILDGVTIGPQRAAPKSPAAINAEVRQIKEELQDADPDKRTIHPLSLTDRITRS